MKANKLAVMFLACALALGSFIGVANAGPQDCPALNGTLTPDQVNAAAKIINDNYTNANALGKALTGKYKALNDELASQAPDQGKIEALSREIGELRGKLLAVRAKMQNQLRAAGVPLPPNSLVPQGPDGLDKNPLGPNFGPRPHRGPHHGFGPGDGPNAPYGPGAGPAPAPYPTYNPYGYWPPCMGMWGMY